MACIPAEDIQDNEKLENDRDGIITLKHLLMNLERGMPLSKHEDGIGPSSKEQANGLEGPNDR